MLRLLRSARPFLGLLVLAVFIAWNAAADFHHHTSPNACDICKALHSAQATLPGGAPRLAADPGLRRQDAPVLPAVSAAGRALPHGRAPPTA